MALRTRLAPALLLPALLAALLAVGRAWAAEDGFDKSPLGSFLLLGSDGPWTGALEGDAYRLTNGSDANAANYLYVDPRGAGRSSWDVSVEVKLESGEQAIAGMIYGLQQEPLAYLALVVESGGTAGLYARSPDGLQRMAAFTKAKLDADGFNLLRIVEEAGAFQVMILNGDQIASVKTDISGTGAVGIFAGGQGSFLFRNFTLTPLEAPAAAAAPADAATAPDAAAQPDATETPDAAGTPDAAPAAEGGASDAAPADASAPSEEGQASDAEPATAGEAGAAAPDLPLPPTPPTP